MLIESWLIWLQLSDIFGEEAPKTFPTNVQTNGEQPQAKPQGK